MIDSFRDEFFFLSNFYEIPVTYRGITYQNSEAAFQAQKTTDPAKQAEFAALSPTEAKRKGRSITLRPDWEQVKAGEMRAIVTAKFTQHPELAAQLLATGDEPLEEGNDWGDRIWGTVNGKGKNLLGIILMEVRAELRTNMSNMIDGGSES